MTDADDTALQKVQPLLRQLREIKGLRASKPGTFQLRGAVFARFQSDADALSVELKKPGGSGFDRYPVETPPQQRKFIDEARLRASRLDDE